jgi:tetratricopeptide (TPR) repeat protein
MDRRGQQHPMWVQEGLACLYEEWGRTAEGELVFPPADRDRQVATLAREGDLLAWEKVLSMEDSDFRWEAPIVYPQVRSMMRFIAASGYLQHWYDEYVAGFGEDPTGARALAVVFGAPVEEVEREWLRWVRERSLVEERELVVERESGGDAAALQRESGGDAAALQRESGGDAAALQSGGDAAYAEARKLLTQGDQTAALEALREVVRLHPCHARAQYDLGLLCMRRGDLPAVQARCQALGSIDPSLASLLANLLHQAVRPAPVRSAAEPAASGALRGPACLRTGRPGPQRF